MIFCKYVPHKIIQMFFNKANVDIPLKTSNLSRIFILFGNMFGQTYKSGTFK